MPADLSPLIAVDPGVGGTGWADWMGRQEAPDRVGVIRPAKGNAPWLDRMRSVAEQFWIFASTVDTQRTYVFECPALQIGGRGHAAAARGDLVKLAMLTGALVCMVHTCKVVLATPSEWKGDLPKEITKRRVRAKIGQAHIYRLGLTKLADHAWDAVGIGLWYRRDK